MTTIIDPADPRATAAIEAIHKGDVPRLRQLLADHPGLATAALGNTEMTRSLLHVATDWPGHYPNVPQVIAALVDAGAEVGTRFTGPHAETPLHWAASSDDVSALDALLDHGADIEADGAVIGGGTALDDAVGFAQWNTARRLVDRGAELSLSTLRRSATSTWCAITSTPASYPLTWPPLSGAPVTAASWQPPSG